MDLYEAVAVTPWLLPVFVLVTLLGVVGAGAVARGLRCNRAVAVLLAGGVGLVLGATVTPGLGQTFSEGTCVAQVDGGLLSTAWIVNDLGRNLLLPVPLGLAVGLVPPPRRRGVLAVAVVLLLGVEGVQLAVPSLGRACQVSDMAANVLGVLLGLVLGMLLRLALPRRGHGQGG